jgi:hypothetical protein
MRALIGITGLAVALVLGACTTESPVTATDGESPMLLTEPLQLTGGDTGHEVLAWRLVLDRAIVLYSVQVCSDPDCQSAETTLRGVDGRGQPWMIADLAGDATFEIDATGSNVAVSSPGGGVSSFPIASPARGIESNVDSRPVPVLDAIPGFTPHNDIAAVLSDGRYLIRGQWDQDEPMESSLQFVNGERTSEPRRPIRLFLYDPANGLLVPVSGIPESTEVSTAVSTSYGPGTVLRVELLAAETLVAYSVGFNGAAYDIEHSLYLAPLPTP